MNFKVIGITGIPGSGKTAVSQILSGNGFHVIDVDQAGKWAVEDERVRNKIAQTFGEEMFRDGELQRKKLGGLVFSDLKALEELNRIVHPVMLQRVDDLLEQFRNAAPEFGIIIDAALLFEVGLDKKCDTTICVWAPIEICIRRSMERDRLDRIQALDRISSQLPQEKKMELAEYLIENSGTLDELRKKVNQLYVELLN